MSIAGSIAGESVYFEQPYSVPGPCRTCCIRCPCPSILAILAFVGGVALFCLSAVLAGQHTSEIFQGTDVSQDMDEWLSYIAIACYVEVAVMVVLAVAFLGISCLGTGAVRKEFMWRFKSRATGRCQTGIFMIVAYFVFLLWLAQCFFALVPVLFFYIQRRGVCEGRPFYDPENDQKIDKPCIDLKQWSLVATDYQREPNNMDKICDAKLVAVCTGNVLLWYSLAFFAAILVTLSMGHYLINLAANFSKLRDRFKDGIVNRKSGAYLVRSGSRHSMRGSRFSLRGSRNNVLSGSHGSLGNLDTNNHAPNVANGTTSTLHMTQGYQNSVLNGSGDNLYATRSSDRDVLDYDREPISALQNHYASRPLNPPPAYNGSRHGMNEPAVGATGLDTGPNTVYGNPHTNGRAPSHTSSSLSHVSGSNASGNFPVNIKMNTLDHNRDYDYKPDEYYPSNNFKPDNYRNNVDNVDSNLLGRVRHDSVGDNSEAVFGNNRDQWGYNDPYNGGASHRRPLSSFTDPEPAPSIGSAASNRAPLRGGFDEHYI